MDEKIKNNIDTKAIEEKALLSVKYFVVDSKVISQYIPENDKEPSWDGHFYLYKKSAKTKEDFIGRVPVQVKGIEVDRFIIKDFKYTFHTSDLRAYQTDPCFFIVCQEKIGTRENKLFYNEFTPEKLKNVLRSYGKQDTVKLKMKPLTENLKEFEDQLILFHTHSKRQQSFYQKNPFTMEDAVAKGVRSFSFVVPPSHSERMKMLRYVTTHQNYLYATIDEDLQLEVPINNTGVMRFSQDINQKVRIGEKVFFNSYRNDIEDGRIVVKIGRVLTISCPMVEEDKSPMEFKFKENVTLLDELIEKAELAIALYEVGTLTVGDVDFNVATNNHQTIETYRERLPHWIELRQTLSKFHLNKQLDVTTITAQQEPLIDLLIQTVGKGELVELPGQNTTLMLMTIGNLNLLVWLIVNSEGKVSIGDYFDNSVQISYKVSKDEVVPASLFSYLRNDQLWTKCDNIPYDQHIPDIEKYATMHNHAFELANIDVLCMIAAGDSLKNKDPERMNLLLERAYILNEWLITNDNVTPTPEIHKVNKLQIEKRRRTLSEEELDYLRSLIDAEQTPPFVKAGSAILLEDPIIFGRWYKCMSKADQATMKEYPIWKLKKRNRKKV